MPADGEITTEDRREFTRLRSLLFNPGSVQVLHSDQASRVWITDEKILLDVTGSPVVDLDIEDGLYHLVTTRGFVRKKGIATINLPIYLGARKWVAWLPAQPTPFSITDNEAKAMLVFVDATPPGAAERRNRIPLAMNQDVWHAFTKTYPEARLWHAGYGGPFRVSIPGNESLAYVEQIQIPIELRGSVQAMLEAIGVEHKGTPGRGENPSGSGRDRGSDGDIRPVGIREGSASGREEIEPQE